MRSRVASLVGVVVLGITLASATQNPTPFVNQPLVPSAVAPGGAGFTLTVNGTGFVSGSTVNWNGSPRTTTFVSGSQVTASILGSDIATAATGSVTVVSPAPGGGTSNVVFLPVREPAGFVSMNTSNFETQLTANVFVVADFNNDGKRDMAVALNDLSGHCTLSILLGNGDGTFRQGIEYAISGCPYGIQSAALNGDGNQDLIVPGLRDSQNNVTLGVLLGNGNGTFQAPVLYAGNAYYNSVLGDFNRDGAIDVAFATNSQVCVFPGNGDGSFQPNVCTNAPTGVFQYITAGDFNADGKLDVALSGFDSNSNFSIAVLLGNGDGTFQISEIYPVRMGTYSLTAADFNGDGKLDLVAVDDPDSTILVLLGNGDGTFRSPGSFPAAYQPFEVATADMNGDGKLDVVVAGDGYNVASVSILLGNGDGTFQNYSDYDGSSLGNFAVDDFNNDGKMDVAVTNSYSTDTITILTQDNGSVLKLSANKLTFALQLLGTVSNPKLIILTNTGTSPVTISNIGVTANFSQLNNCKTVQPGHTCKIGVYFTPTITGNITGYLAIANNGGGSPQIVNLFGTATIVSISPGRLDFGDWPVGRISTSQKVVVTNEGNGSMNITQIGIVGPNSKDFSEVNACPGKLAAGASCTISVIFHPSAKGARSATLGIVDSGGGSPQKVPLTGTGT